MKFLSSFDEVYFASTAPNIIIFGLILNLVEFFKFIQHPEFSWIWTPPQDTLRNMSDRKQFSYVLGKALKIFKVFKLFYALHIYCWD